MSRAQETILTNMCLVEDTEQGLVLVQERHPKRYRWSGIAFPGGHIEKGENFHDAVVREVLEETGITITHPKLVGLKHWQTQNDQLYLVFLYKATEFSGELTSSEEGEVYWLPKQELSKHPLAYDLLEILKVMEDDNLSEFFYPGKDENGEWIKAFR